MVVVSITLVVVQIPILSEQMPFLVLSSLGLFRVNDHPKFLIITGDKTKSLCTRIVALDPKGNIPTWVINLGKKKAATSYVVLKQFVLDELRGKSVTDEDEDEVEVQKIEKIQEKPKPADVIAPVHLEKASNSPPKLIVEEISQPVKDSKREIEYAPVNPVKVTQEGIQSEEVVSMLEKMQKTMQNLETKLLINDQRMQQLESAVLKSLSLEPLPPPNPPMSRLPSDDQENKQNEGSGMPLLISFALVWPFAALALMEFIKK